MFYPQKIIRNCGTDEFSDGKTCQTHGSRLSLTGQYPASVEELFPLSDNPNSKTLVSSGLATTSLTFLELPLDFESSFLVLLLAIVNSQIRSNYLVSPLVMVEVVLQLIPVFPLQFAFGATICGKRILHKASSESICYLLLPTNEQNFDSVLFKVRKIHQADIS